MPLPEYVRRSLATQAPPADITFEEWIGLFYSTEVPEDDAIGLRSLKTERLDR